MCRSGKEWMKVSESGKKWYFFKVWEDVGKGGKEWVRV